VKMSSGKKLGHSNSSPDSMALPSPSVTALLKGEQLRQEVYLYRVSRGAVWSADTKNQRMESRTSVKIT